MRGRVNHWLISDTHFGHNRLVDLGSRPEDFESQLIDNLNCIKGDDIVYHLGDVSFYKHKYWHQLFNHHCKARVRILIMGNHDNQTYSWYYSHGWTCVCSEMGVDMYGLKILLTHVPLLPNELDIRGVDVINVHGHIHNTNHREALLTERHFPVIMEHEYKPILLQQLVGM